MRTTATPQVEASAATLWRCGGRDCGVGECEHDENELRRHAAGTSPSTAGAAPSVHRVSHPDDASEREAERIADAVMRGDTTVGAATPVTEGSVQRKGMADMSEFVPHDEVMRRASGPGPRAGTDLEQRIQSLRGRGQSLDQATRAFMENRLGHDFGRVRVHNDENGAQAARSVNAHAFTVGRDIAFAAGQYQPATRQGRRLLAHELAHVVQQRGQPATSTPTAGVAQRDLATPPPAEPVADQPDLTDAQIATAIAFNRGRYDERNTRLIQSLLGGPVTGSWTRENIVAIAATQEEYGLTADGKVGSETFRFLNQEQRLEQMPTTDRNCLTAFQVNVATVRFVGTNPASIQGFYTTASEFSSRCRCSDFQYRQFIRGHARHIRGATTTDISGPINGQPGPFSRIPGGRLPADFVEDGDVHDNPVNYGHRDQPADDDPVDLYINDRGGEDQANGCRYRSNDTCGLRNVTNIQAGDVFDLNMNFRGEIQRNGRTVQTKRWTAINGRFRIP